MFIATYVLVFYVMIEDLLQLFRILVCCWNYQESTQKKSEFFSPLRAMDFLVSLWIGVSLEIQSIKN